MTGRRGASGAPASAPKWRGSPPTQRATPAFAPVGRLLTSPAPGLVLSAAGGLATETAFPRTSWWPMAYVGVALLLLALRQDSVRWGALSGTAFGFAFFLPHLWWANESVGQPIGWIALSSLEATAVGGFGAAWVLTRRMPILRDNSWLRVLAPGLLWVAVEQVRGLAPFGGFPWGLLAFSQTDAPLLRLAAIGSTPLVSFVVVVLGALLAEASEHLRHRRVRSALVSLVVLVGLTAVPFAVPLDARAQSGTLRVGAVQGNVPTPGADAMVQARTVTANHVAGTRALLSQVGQGRLDVVLWPESASDIDPRTDGELGAAVDSVARAAGAPILLGTQRFYPGLRYNDYILWEAKRGGTASYTKQHPVPFGEYIPYRPFFRKLSSAVDLITRDMAAGTQIALLRAPIERLGRSVPITTAICFEVAYDELIRESVVAGGELIVIPTNNASFGRTQESTQQLAMTRFRAVEHGRAAVQISTVGVSGIIDPDGRLLQRTGLFTSEQMFQELPLRTSITISDRLGRWPALAVDTLALVLLAGGLLASAERHPATSRLPKATAAFVSRRHRR
jgi:apolipoprotein N-acyltransferase